MSKTKTVKWIAAGFLLAAATAWANHPVFVEGNCMVPPFGFHNSGVVPVGGTCGDFDGDGRIGTAEDIAEVALFLVSDASRFITGEEFAVDGGLIQRV